MGPHHSSPTPDARRWYPLWLDRAHLDTAKVNCKLILMENSFVLDDSSLENSLTGIEFDNQCYCNFCMEKLQAENNSNDDDDVLPM